MTEDNIRLHAVIEGHVQGVGFRAFVMDQALRLPVTGWVRNTFTGDVEVVAEGTRPVLDSLLTALHKGPRGSHVVNVHEDWLPASGEFTRFQIVFWG